METGKNKLGSFCFGQTKQEEFSQLAHLLIECEVDQISFSIIDQKAKQCVGLCSYPFDIANSDTDRRAEIRSFFKENQAINFPFSKRQIIISSRECVFVPEEVFRKEEQEDYIESSFENEYTGKVFSQAIPLLKNHLVYKTPDWLLKIIDDHLSGSIISHSSAFLADALYRISRQKEDLVVHSHFRRSSFDLFIFNNGKMLFYNSFAYQTSEDIAYFIMYALKQWNLENCGLSVSGIFDTNSDELFWLKKYVHELLPFPETNLLPYPAAIDNPSAYINLLNPTFCE